MKQNYIKVFKALGYYRRIKILKKINDSKLKTTTSIFLSKELGIPKESMRFHLNELVKANLIKKEKRKSLYIYISVNLDLIKQTQQAMKELV
ncbi:MAG: ArsR/SmtB family transcription factor [Alphaproteobacteria bacterium]|nr:MAG: hypothetical protein B6I23_01130 [Rickettsiaceae bacterium 4572_127]